MIKLPSSSSLAGKSNKLNPKLSCFWSSCFRELFVFSWNEFCSSMVAPQNRDYQSWGLATYNFGDSPTTDPPADHFESLKRKPFSSKSRVLKGFASVVERNVESKQKYSCGFFLLFFIICRSWWLKIEHFLTKTNSLFKTYYKGKHEN